jgi:hypothetical protein
MNTTKSDRYSAPYLTEIDGYPDRSVLKAGMAHFAGSGPPGQTCGSCQYIDGAIKNGESKARCAMFKKLTGRKGEIISPKYPSCKYFEAKPKKPSIVRPARNQGAGISTGEAELLRALRNSAPRRVK